MPDATIIDGKPRKRAYRLAELADSGQKLKMEILVVITFFVCIQPLTAFSSGLEKREYYCIATDAMIKDFLSNPKRPLYMQRVNQEGFNLKLTRAKWLVVLKNTIGHETSYPILRMG